MQSNLSDKQIAEINLKYYKEELRDYTRAFDYCPESSNFYDYFLNKVIDINDKIDELEKLLNTKL